MKKVLLSAITIMALSSVSTAGKNVAPVLSEVEPIAEVTPKIENNGFYVGLGYTMLGRYTTEKFSTKSHLSYDIKTSQNILASVGYKYNDYIAVEGRYLFEMNHYSERNNNLFEEYNDVSTYGIYLKPMYPIPFTEDRLVVYALLGYAKHSFTKESKFLSTVKTTIDEDANGFSFGAGLEFILTSKLSVGFDVLNFQNGYEYKENFTTITTDTFTRNIESDIYSINMMITYTF